MAVTINASTTAGLVNTADTSGVLELQTAGTTAVTVDASQNVGIGTASPADKLHVAISSGSLGGIRVQNTNSGGQSAVSYYNDAATQKADIWWNNSGSTLNLRTLSTDPMIFSTNNSERMRVNAGAPILCLSGGSTTATGTGIAFPATQSASTDANTLDDYEEGAWTPTVTSSGGSITAVTIGGQYRKVGGLVSLQFSYQITNNGTGSGIVYVSNLPFTNTVGANTGVAIMKEIAVNGSSGVAYFVAGTQLFCTTYNSGYPGGTNQYWLGSICYYA
jgi:hypothetical protein